MAQDVSETTLKLKTVASIIAIAITLAATTVTTILSIKADSKERFDQLQIQLIDQKNYYTTELRVLNLRVDKMEDQDVIQNKTLELMAKSLSDLQRTR